jgi:hypothetical protein
MAHTYEATVKGVMEWANSELEHVGRIVSIGDEDLQYSYAQSTVYGMAHLKDALAQLVEETEHADKKRDLLRIHDKVIRAMKHLIKDFDIDLEAIKAFNTRHVLSDLSYLSNSEESEESEQPEQPEESEEPSYELESPSIEGGKRKARKTRRKRNMKKRKMSRKNRKNRRN